MRGSGGARRIGSNASGASDATERRAAPTGSRDAEGTVTRGGERAATIGELGFVSPAVDSVDGITTAT